jgi:hypothetical protein
VNGGSDDSTQKTITARSHKSPILFYGTTGLLDQGTIRIVGDDTTGAILSDKAITEKRGAKF